MKPLLSLSLFLVSLSAIGQPHTATLDAVVDAVNQHSSAPLESFLSSEFSIAGHEGEMAEIVLSQVFIQIADSVFNYEIKSADDNELIAVIVYEKLGEKEATLYFSNSGLLTSLELFPMEVKSVHGPANVVDTRVGTKHIPFELAGNLIRIQVELNGEMRPFLLDTGAPRVILNKKYFAGQGTMMSREHKGVNGSIDNVEIVGLASLDFAGIRMEEQDYLAMDLEHLEKELGASFYGLLGYDLIAAYDLLFNYETQTLTLLEPGNWPEGWSENNTTTVPMKMNGHIPVIEVEVDGELYSVGIDCGAESNLFDDELFDDLSGVIKNPRSDFLNGADKLSKRIQKGEVNATAVGELIFTDMTTVFSDISHLNEGYSLELDGLVGFQLLSVYPTLLRFGSQELVFQSL